VTITCATPGSTIYYTTGGRAPTTSSMIYGTSVSVTGDGTAITIQAIAVAPGMTPSAVGSAAYTIDYSQVSTPQFSPSSGTVSSDQLVTITCTTPGTTTYYTTDGTTPTALPPSPSAVYSAPIPVAGNGTAMTIQAFAVASEMKVSAVAFAAYTIIAPIPQTPWAQTVAAGSNQSDFSSVAVDSLGNIFAAGAIYGPAFFDFGFDATATAPYAGVNVVLVKY